MKHFGIWCIQPATWLIDINGVIFWTSSKAVAEAYLVICNKGTGNPRPLEVREFIDDTEELGQPQH